MWPRVTSEAGGLGLHCYAPSLDASFVANLHLLLLVDLTSVDKLLDRSCSQQPINRDVACLTEPEGPAKESEQAARRLDIIAYRSIACKSCAGSECVFG